MFHKFNSSRKKVISSFNFNCKWPFDCYSSELSAEGGRQWLYLISWWRKVDQELKLLFYCPK